MIRGYRETLILLCVFCQVVPSVAAFSPATKTRFLVARLTIYFGSIGLGLGALIFIPVGPLKRAVYAASLMVLLQYLIFALLRRGFEKKYGRTPTVTLLDGYRNAKWEDRRMSLVCWFLSVAAIFLVLMIGGRVVQ